MKKEQLIKQVEIKYNLLKNVFNEYTRRLWLGTEAMAIGRGGQTIVTKATGVNKNTVLAGVKEIKANKINLNQGQVRKKGGGSNGSSVRMWKTELQELANEIDIEIHVSHFPPGTSKWNKIEHKMFSFISKNWRGRPLIDRATVVKLIGSTTTKKGLEIKAELDENIYEKGIKISDEELAKVNLERDIFHGEWNYIISPNMS